MTSLLNSSLVLSLLMITPTAFAQDAKKEDLFVSVGADFNRASAQMNGGSGTAGIAGNENQQRLFQALDNGGSGTAGGDHPSTLSAWSASSKAFKSLININAGLNPDVAHHYYQDYFIRLRESVIVNTEKNELQHSWLYTSASSTLFMDGALAEQSAKQDLILAIYAEAMDQVTKASEMTLKQSAKSWLEFIKNEFTMDHQSKIIWKDASRVTETHRALVLNEMIPQVIAYLGKSASQKTINNLNALVSIQDAEKFNQNIAVIIQTIASEK